MKITINDIINNTGAFQGWLNDPTIPTKEKTKMVREALKEAEAQARNQSDIETIRSIMLNLKRKGAQEELDKRAKQIRQNTGWDYDKAFKAALDGMPEEARLYLDTPGKPKKYEGSGPPAGEVDRLAKQYINNGEAENYPGALEVVRKKNPEVWAAYSSR